MEITRHLLLLALACVGAVLGEVSFSLRDCTANKETELFSVPRAQLSPYPVGIPGDLSVTGTVNLNRDATGSVSLDLTVERYVGFLWVTVPCISEVGSCTYNDVCQMLSSTFGTTGCPAQLRETHLNCTCPVPAGTYSLANAVFPIPELSGVWSWLAEGDYRVTAKLIDNPTGNEIACQKLEATIVDGHPPCSGFLCSIFG